MIAMEQVPSELSALHVTVSSRPDDVGELSSVVRFRSQMEVRDPRSSALTNGCANQSQTPPPSRTRRGWTRRPRLAGKCQQKVMIAGSEGISALQSWRQFDCVREPKTGSRASCLTLQKDRHRHTVHAYKVARCAEFHHTPASRCIFACRPRIAAPRTNRARRSHDRLAQASRDPNSTLRATCLHDKGRLVLVLGALHGGILSHSPANS